MSDTIKKGDFAVAVQTSPKPDAPHDCYIVGYELTSDHGAQHTIYKYPGVKADYDCRMKGIIGRFGRGATGAKAAFDTFKP